MLPIGLLMREHRRIERMVEGLRGERESVRRGVVDPVFIDNAVDFFRTYADRTHHGKEEDILFRDLEKFAQRDEMLVKMREFDASLIHERYGKAVEAFERRKP